jgi:hypothetical protein
MQFRRELPPGTGLIQGVIGTELGSYYRWESEQLSVMAPLPGAVPGADRGVCHTVNGWLAVTFEDKSIFNPANDDARTRLRLYAGLYGMYGGISGVIAKTEIPLSDPALLLAYGSNGAVGFDTWSSFANLADKIYIRFMIVRIAGGTVPLPAIPQPFSISAIRGALIGSDFRY